MLSTTKLSCQGCGAELASHAAPGQIVTCEYCGTRNVVHATGAAAANADGGSGGGGSGSGMAPPPPPPPAQGYDIQWSGEGSSYPAQAPTYAPPPRPPVAAPKPAAKGALLLGLVSAVMVVGAVLYFMTSMPSPSGGGKSSATKTVSSEGDQGDKAGSARDRRRAELAKRRAELAKRRAELEKRRAERAGQGGAGPARGGGASGLPDVAEPAPLRFESERPLVTDLDGDGVDDVVARAYLGTGRDQAVVALSGKGWRELWRAPIVGSRGGKLHPGGDALLLSQGNELRALEPKTGVERWKAPLDDAVSLVLPRKDRVAVELRNGSTVELYLATGAPAEDKAKRIIELPRDDSRLWLSNLGRELAPSAAALGRLRFEMFYCPDALLLRGKTVTRTQGFITSRSTTYGCKAPRALAFATAAKGTRFPFLVGLGRGGKILWEERMTPPKTTETVSGTPAADVLDDRVALAYQLGRGASFLAAVQLTDGKVLWQKALETRGQRGPNIRGVVLGRDRIYLRADQELQVFAFADGRRLR